MSKVFIDHLLCKKQHRIFTGKNALRHALFYKLARRACTDEQLLFRMTDAIVLKDAMCWGEERLDTGFKVKGQEVLGSGNHSKIYTLEDGTVIFSSQNNGNSPLFEFAILYDETELKGKLWSFVGDTFKRCAEYRRWFKVNGKPFAGKFRGNNGG